VNPKDPNRVLNIGSQLNPELKSQLIVFLRANPDVFAWDHSDMCGISPEVAVHKLNIDPSVKQKRRTQGKINSFERGS